MGRSEVFRKGEGSFQGLRRQLGPRSMMWWHEEVAHEGPDLVHLGVPSSHPSAWPWPET